MRTSSVSNVSKKNPPKTSYLWLEMICCCFLDKMFKISSLINPARQLNCCEFKTEISPIQSWKSPIWIFFRWPQCDRTNQHPLKTWFGCCDSVSFMRTWRFLFKRGMKSGTSRNTLVSESWMALARVWLTNWLHWQWRTLSSPFWLWQREGSTSHHPNFLFCGDFVVSKWREWAVSQIDVWNISY